MLRISAVKSHVDLKMIQRIIDHLALTRVTNSEAMFMGTCPMCGHERSFTLWHDKGAYRCFWCGCDGRFVITPERIAEEREKMRRIMETSEA